MAADSYLRFPHVCGDTITFVAEDDIWLVGRDGGRAWRVSADRVPVRSPRLSPDGTRVAWTAVRDGAPEVYVAGTDGGVSRRLTFWGDRTTAVRGWWSDHEVLVVSATGEPDSRCMYAYAVPIDGSPGRRLPYGWAADLVFGPDGGALLATPTTAEPAWWKHYRGGTASQLWLDLDDRGEFRRIFPGLRSGLVSPLWTRTPDGRQRIGFISDHEGRGQIFSATVGKRAPSAGRLTAHTTAGDYYARHATSDGEQVVYEAGGSLYLLDNLDPATEPRSVEVTLAGPRTARQPHPVHVSASILETAAPDHTGRASALEVRGGIWWVTHTDGPARAVADSSDVRRRLPVLLGDGSRLAWVSDADGDDSVWVGDPTDDDEPQQLVASGRVGRVLEMAASPDGRRLAIATHDGRLLLATVPAGRIARAARLRQVDDTDHGDFSGLAFSPDSRWLAWSAPGPEPLAQIRIARTDTRAQPIDVTPLRFTDTEPVFTCDGKHLAFLSVRSLDPVYDAFVFDLSFPGGCRPHLVPLAADTPSPFAPMLAGRPPGGKEDGKEGADKAAADNGAGKKDGDKDGTPPETVVDVDGLAARLVPLPVAAGRYSRLCAVDGGLVWLNEPLRGQLGDDLATLDDDSVRARLEHLDFATRKTQTLADTADSVVASGDGKRLVVRDKAALRVVPATRKPEEDSPDAVEVDLSRVRVEVDPPAEWRQMYDEAWRLMRDHFWRADMGGTDWQGAHDRYAPLLEQIASHDDLIDLIWEMHGELGSSHAYCMPPAPRTDAARRQGLLGADLEFTGERWRVARVVPGESSDRRARSPLAAPGVAARPGDAIVAVDGRPTSATTSPGALLLGTAGRPVELTLAPRGGGDQRRVVVVPMADETPLRYQDWVNERRAYVHAQTDGTVGYVHVPDMMSPGWAQLHRDLRTEVARDALVVDVRGNRGGHTSQLVVEKLARQIIGWDLVREGTPESYPSDARRGPMVALADMYSGSDGDIVTAAIRSLQLGPVIGTRTWGGVIGIDGRYHLVDGTVVTQPRYSFWFTTFGWGVENHGVDPDIEVVATPQDHVAGHDVQLDRALDVIRRRLRRQPAAQPPPIPPLR